MSSSVFESPTSFIVENGLLVASENPIIKTSLSPYTASAPSGSSAINDVMNGPSFSPKVPASSGDDDTDGSDSPSAVLRLPPDCISNLNSPTSGGVAPVASTIVIIKVLGLSHWPEYTVPILATPFC